MPPGRSTLDVPTLITLARRVARRGDPRIRLDDRQSTCYLAGLRAWDRFDPARGVPFSAFATRHMQWALNRLWRQESHHWIDELDAPVSSEGAACATLADLVVDPRASSPEETVVTNQTLEVVIRRAGLSDDERAVLMLTRGLRGNAPHSVSQAAEVLNLSAVRTRTLRDSVIRKLKTAAGAVAAA